MKLLKRVFGGKGQPGDAAAQVARSLFEGWIQKDQAPPLSREALPRSLWQRYERKWGLYREATVLAVRLGREEKDPRYSELVKEYERLIYPSSEPTAEGLAKASALKAAMLDISELVFHRKGKELTWAREWFEELGGLPDNPVDCMQFGLCLMELQIAVAETVDAFATEGIFP
jgi:hypothetical protein